MFDSLNAQLGKLLGKRDDDPQSTITADQLKVVLKSIEGKYNNLKNENKLFKSKIEEQKSTIAELERTVGELKGGNVQAESSLLTQLESDLDATRTQLNELRETHEQARNEKLQLQSKLSVQEALVASLRHELSELREQQAAGVTPEEHAKAVTEREKLKGDLAGMQQKVQELAGKLIEAETALEEVEELKSALDQAEKELLSAKEEAKGSGKGLKKLESERTALLERLESLTDEVEVLKDAREAFVAEKEARQSVLEDLKGQLKGTQETIKNLEQDKTELAQKVQKQQGEIAKLEEQLASGGGVQSEVMGELEARYMQAKARTEQLQAENEALQSRLQQLLSEPGGMGTREKTEYEMQVRRLTEELREAGLQIGSLRETKVKASLDLEEAAAELVELRRQVEDLRRDRNFYRERVESLRESQGEVDQIKGQMRELMGEMSRLRGGEAPSEPAPRVASEGARQIGWTTSRRQEAERPASLRETPKRQPEPPAPEPAPPQDVQRRREMLNKLIGNKKPR
ncbi:MAG: hypothetical protein ACLGIN_17870 [Candidatus Sericytochromatia bacterium]